MKMMRLNQPGAPAEAGSTGAATEYAYRTQDFEAIAALVYDHAGITLADGKATMVYSRLAKLIRARGLDSFADYIALVRRDPREMAACIEALTTNHTRLFREGHHFEHFHSQVRSALLGKAMRRNKVRLWSAGCSSGEEVYSLTMTLLGRDRDASSMIAGADVLLLASDINEQVLTKGREARYRGADVTDIPEPYRTLWTRSEESGFTIRDEARRLVRFRQLNLLHKWPIDGQFDVIFCRNTMIYFDEETKARLLSGFADRLLTGGYLYIGHSERLVGPSTAQFKSVGQTIYQKVAA